jgi:hypothetical protein
MALTAAAPVAHHSHVYFYDQCTSVTIDGRVDSVQFTGPHVRMVVRLDDGTTYTVDWMTPNNLRRNGIFEAAEQALTPGARVSVVGAPIRTAAEIRGYLPDFIREVNATTVDATLIRRVDDSFRWSRRSQNPALCKEP